MLFVNKIKLSSLSIDVLIIAGQLKQITVKNNPQLHTQCKTVPLSLLKENKQLIWLAALESII